jgi:outer membrane receptor protein involved in Fe transport
MKRPSFRRHCLAAASLTALAAPFAARAQSADAAAPEAQLERVVITSEKRMTLLDKTPAAVTALSGSKLQESGYTTLVDVANLAPNTVITGQGQGATQIFVRGIGNVFILAGGDPGVALYADGAYISDQTSTNVSLFDLDRIEVLRGPQGALYGRNATGGAVNLLSAMPASAFRASANVVLGNYGRKESEGFVSTPLGDGGTRVRVSYQVKKLDGWTSNPLAGTTSLPVIGPGPNTTGPDRLDDLDSRALRVQTLSDLGNAGTLRLIAGHYRQDDAGASVPLLVDPVMLPGLLFNATPSTDPRVVKSQGSSNKVEVNHGLARWSLPIRDNTLNVTASWRKSRQTRFFDSDGTEALVTSTHFETASSDKSIDVHLVSPDGQKLQWLVGATALVFDQNQDVAVASQVPLGFLMPGAPLTTPFPLHILLGGNIHTRSQAVYTDLRYALTPQLALLGGFRFNRDHKTSDEYQNLVTPLGGNPLGPNPLDKAWNSKPWSLGVEYQFNPSALAYGRISHGFKSGAVNLGALQGIVDPETVTAAEVGLKLDFLQRRGLFSAALFTSRYKDMQVSQVGQFQVILANASRASIDGAEFELSLRPVPALTVNASLGLMDPRYTDFTNTDLRNNPGAAVNVAGNQLAQASKKQLSLGAEYVLPIEGWRATVRADYQWRSTVYFTEFNTPDARQPSYGIFNLAFSAKPVNARWKLFGYVKNLGNTTAITSLSVASPILGAARQVTYTPPRLYGIGAQVDF